MDREKKNRIFHDGLLDSDEKFRVLVEHAVIGTYIIRNGHFTYVNERFAEIFGYSREELIGKSNLDLTHPDDREKTAEKIRQRVEGMAESIEYSFRGLTKTGEIKYIRVYGSVFHYEGERAIIGTLIDETEMVEARKELQKLANYDSLTGLFNRRVFQLEFERAIELGKRRGHRVALILIDLDNFKRINDSLGHKMGDEVLHQLSQRIKKLLRVSDLFARMGGDEFAIIVEDFYDLNEIAHILRKIQKSMKESIAVDHIALRLNLSLGIALFPEHGKEADTLQKAADIALYEAKKQGKNRYAFFARNSDTLLTKLRLETELSTAVEQGEIQMYLQPQFDTQTHTLLGAEALIRWAHPREGLLYPKEFLSLAGEAGELYKLDLFILKQALVQLQRWHRDKKDEIQLSVNVSNALFHHQEFLLEMRKLYDTFGALLCQIELELTEEILLENEIHANHIIHALKVMGFKLSIDDFGTGYSSLSHLKKLQVDKIKIDRSFIKELILDSQDHIIVEAIIVMGHALGLEVLAEGVETEKQLDILKDMGCDSIQGFYFSQGIPLNLFEQKWMEA